MFTRGCRGTKKRFEDDDDSEEDDDDEKKSRDALTTKNNSNKDDEVYRVMSKNQELSVIFGDGDEDGRGGARKAQSRPNGNGGDREKLNRVVITRII